MFENLKESIRKELETRNITNLDEYIYELHEILPNYIVNVPEQSDYEFYEFAGKFMQYLTESDNSIIPNDLGYVAELIIICHDELCNVTNALSSLSGEYITADIIKILSTYNNIQKTNINEQFTTSEELEIILNRIFSFINHDWENLYGVILEWDIVLENVLTSDETEYYDAYAAEYNSDKNELKNLKRRRELGLADTLKEELENELMSDEDEIIDILTARNEITSNIFNVNQLIDWIENNTIYSHFDTSDSETSFERIVRIVSEYWWGSAELKNEDDTNFDVNALFSFLCVTGPNSAKRALQIIYDECGWVGHPEDELVENINFPNYGIIEQEEADWFNANMNAIFDNYDGDPCEYALSQIGSDYFESDEEDEPFMTHEEEVMYHFGEEGAKDMGYDSDEDEFDSDENDPFIATGYKTTSNLGGKEIQINDAGDIARIKYEDGTISKWCEIEYSLDVDGPYIDLGSEVEYLDSYIKY